MSDIVEQLRIGATYIKAQYRGSSSHSAMLDEAAYEIDGLRRWKAEAMTVLDQWEQVWEAAGHPGRLGGSKAERVRAEITRLRAAPADLPAGWSWRREPGDDRFCVYRIDYGDDTIARIAVRRAKRDHLGLPGPAVFGSEIAEGVVRLLAARGDL